MKSGVSLSKKSRPATAPLAQGWTKFFHLVAPSAHIGGCAPYNPRYIAKKCTAGERVEGDSPRGGEMSNEVRQRGRAVQR